ncbi:MAG TPA: SIS domain-containing protein [Dongiaceae bacterium]|nr:SIS domain-containing protein [Dongiaceae bacterium]
MSRKGRTRTGRVARAPLESEVRGWLEEATRTLRRTTRACAGPVAAAAEVVIGSLETGGTIYFCGNGGSAADAQHLAAEFAGRFMRERTPLGAVALTTNSSAVTAIGNDYGYDEVFSRQLEGLGTPGDVLIAITTSGSAESVRRAVHTAHRLGMTVIGMTGARGGAFAALCDVALATPHTVTSHVQEGHIAMGHALCLVVERALFPESRAGGGRDGHARPAGRGARTGVRGTRAGVGRVGKRARSRR